ncbi:hypothetical protein HNR60_001613 [Rhodopseudomonas rhenobacensis]|uniref:Uncharacterized protein n=1 Tax=Rhodopseudomonas rhenobacensis TaxID=87461 RepID=A0A7W8DY33_9BRAD|nr:hypothetical protein [Rhodopseudomonas rhenobacensis]MBB5046864.1 hypothetical protein [Rhodopseudomonas rhenobacensis]
MSNESFNPHAFGAGAVFGGGMAVGGIVASAFAGVAEARQAAYDRAACDDAEETQAYIYELCELYENECRQRIEAEAREQAAYADIADLQAQIASLRIRLAGRS